MRQRDRRRRKIDRLLDAAEFELAKASHESNARAVVLLSEAIELRPRDGAAHARLCRAYLQRAHTLGMGRNWLDAALREGEKAVAHAPNAPEALAALGTVYAHRGWLSKHRQLAERALPLAPDDPELLNSLGWVLWFTGRADEALPLLLRVADLQPEDPWAQFYLGNALLRLGDEIGAIGAYGKCIRLKADHSSGHAGLIWSLLSAGREADAREALARFQALEPDEDRYDVKIADLEVALGDLESARRHAEHALAHAPESRYRPRGLCASTILAAILSASARTTAERLLDESTALDKARVDLGDEGYEVHYDLAAIYSIRGDSAAALAALARAVTAGWWYPQIAVRDPLLRHLHQQAAFSELMEAATQVSGRQPLRPGT